ncbi:MAG: ABC transporter ATP-binding protein [Bryobacterales bacterium]|nr:ABC transporter ATP-binding protein [Bryobacterales bacterium]
MSTIAIRVDHLSKQYTLGAGPKAYSTLRESLAGAAQSLLDSAARLIRRKAPVPADTEFYALDDLSFEVAMGTVVGVIGRNGAGKSTLLKVLSRITEPTDGFADIRGRVGSLLEVGTGFHGELTGRENILLNGAILGMKHKEIVRKFDDIVAFAEVERFVDTPVKFYSSGMYLRLAFAVAAHLEPEILLVDEVLAVGDLAFQKKCLGKMDEVAKEGRTVVFVSHNMGAVRSLCTHGVVLERGRLHLQGAIGAAIEAYYRLSNAADAQERAPGKSGFGRVEIAGQESMTIDQGDAIELATTLQVPDGVTGFTIMCLMQDMHQRPVLHLRQDSPALRNSACWSGLQSVRVGLPPLWLEPGLYSVHFKVLFWGQVAQARYVSDVVHIDVGGECSGWGAVLTPKANWSIEARS